MTPAAFFTLLYPSLPTDAALTVWTMPSKVSTHHGSVAAAEAAALAVDGLQHDAYFGVCLRAPGLGRTDRGNKRQLAYAPGLFVDIDIGQAGHKATNCAPDEETALELLAAAGVEPTVIVHSGGGLHAYWLFTDDPEHPGGLYALHGAATAGSGRPPVRVTQYERLLEAIQGRIIAAGMARGYVVDNTAESTRVLRVPGTHNRKVPTAPRPVTVVDATGPRWSFSYLTGALGLVTQGLSARPPVTAPTSPTVSTSSPSATAAAGGPGPVVPRSTLLQRLGALKDPAHHAAWGDILAGRSFASSQRDSALQRAASVVAWMAPDNPVGTGDRATGANAHPEDLAELFRASLTVWAGEPGATLSLEEEMEKAVDKLTRAQEDARQERQRIADEDARIVALFDRAPTEGGTTYNDADLEEFAEVAGVTPAAPPPDMTDPAALARHRHRALVEALQRHWLIERGGVYYILTDIGNRGKRYSAPFVRASLGPALPLYLERAPIDWYRVGAKGQPVRKDLNDLLMDYSSAAEEVHASLTAQHSRFDANTRIFHEAVCPIRPSLRPVQHPDVHAWLEVLGGGAGTDTAERLLDWVASVTRLDRQCCALYLSGPPGTGKTLLATGLARIWHEGGPSELANVFSDFNSDIARCPLILADEALPPAMTGKQTSSRLRELLGTTTRALKRKHLPNAEIHGNIRLIMTANNERLLAFNEDMEPQDLQAFAERVLHIDTAGAAAYLAGLGGPAYVNRWVVQDRIAEHALWLRENRTIQDDGRWLVKGTMSKVHMSIATRGMLQGLVTEWLVRYLMDPRVGAGGIPANAPIRAGGGQYVVNTAVVSQFWDQYIRSEKTPDTARVGRILKGLSTGREVRLAGLTPGSVVRCHEVNCENLYAWSQENQVGEPDALRARVNAPVAVGGAVAPVPAPPAPATVHSINASITAHAAPSTTPPGHTGGNP